MVVVIVVTSLAPTQAFSIQEFFDDKAMPNTKRSTASVLLPPLIRCAAVTLAGLSASEGRAVVKEQHIRYRPGRDPQT